MTNKAQCNCKGCGINHEIDIDDRSLCKACYKIELDKFFGNKKPKTWWSGIKRFSYIALLTMPLFFTVGLIYGIQVQIISIFSLFLGQIISPLVDWLSEKF